jgi:hypothetical protein
MNSPCDLATIMRSMDQDKASHVIRLLSSVSEVRLAATVPSPANRRKSCQPITWAVSVTHIFIP